METRLNAYKASPDAIATMTRLEEYVQNWGLEHSLIHLVKTRASQINGCAYCLHMHTSDAREAGESEVRFYLLSAWCVPAAPGHDAGCGGCSNPGGVCRA